MAFSEFIINFHKQEIMKVEHLLKKGWIPLNNILNQEERYEAFMTLLESRLDRSLTEKEAEKLRWLAGAEHENFQIFRNIFEELGSKRADN